MSTDFATVLDDCLDRLKAGDTISACLESYPDHASELKPLLETVEFVNALRFTEAARPQALARGRQRLLTEAARLREERREKERSFLTKVRDFFSAGAPGPVWARAAAVIVVVLLLFGAVSGVVVQASESSLPGDALYPVKQVKRQVQLIVIRNPQEREEKEKQILAEERQEVRQATEQGRVFEKDVAGIVVAWEDGSLVLEDGLDIRVSDETEVQGEPAVGVIALVHVRSENGRLVAERIQVRQQAQAVVLVALTDTATVTSTATARPTDTPVPTATPEPTKIPTKKVVPTKTATPKPTFTDTPFPTATVEVGPIVHVFELRGRIDAIGDSMWVVAGEQIRITSDTIIKGEPAVGRTAHVRANRLADGQFVAIEIDVETPDTPTPARVTITGVVESKERDNLWHIGGREVRLDDRTKVEGELRVGAFAEVRGVQESPRRVYAHRITIIRPCETPILFEGVIVAIDAEAGTWTVEVAVSSQGQEGRAQFNVNVTDAQIEGTPVIGAVAQIEACRTGENEYSAQRIFVVPTPTPTDTPAATPTLTDTPQPTVAPTSSPSVTVTPEPPSLQSTPTLAPAATVTPSPQVSETDTPTVEPPAAATRTAVPDDVTPTASS